MSSDQGPTQQEEPDPEASGCGGQGDEAVWMLDAEELNVTWSGVRPGVNYIRGGLTAQRAATAARLLYPHVKHHAALDRVQAMTDLDGKPYLRVDLNTAGVYDLVALVLDGLRFRGELASGAG